MQLLRPMKPADIDAVVDVIDSHDDDDAAEARVSYTAPNGTDDQFVLEQNGAIIGVTGFATPPGCDHTHWLSWTYIHEDEVNQGLGRKIITEVIDHLREAGARKLFIKVSDYSEKNDVGREICVYAAAIHLYQLLGFKTELVLKDYYDEDETMTILGMRVASSESDDDSNQSHGWEKQKLQFNSIFEIFNSPGPKPVIAIGNTYPESSFVKLLKVCVSSTSFP